jgi:acyl-coenzyme A synthetase/AMP-(fatty) acid ligase
MALAGNGFLRARLASALNARDGAALHAADRSVALSEVAGGFSLDCEPDELRGRSVLLRTRSQISAALALVDLDGVAWRVVICPPDFDPAHLEDVIARAEIDLVASDDETLLPGGLDVDLVRIGAPRPMMVKAGAASATEWVMFTSGTTGAPKMAAHTLDALTGAIRPPSGDSPVVWGTFYDIRRYGGLQILLRALTGGASMILSDPKESPVESLTRLARYGVTHLSGTPSHWRRALPNLRRAAISPRYARLSGEIADQAVLDALKTALPGASVGHAYASTEAGVGFEVTDGREGFPEDFVGRPMGDVEMRVVDGSLQIRSPRTASRYIGDAALRDDDGFVDTGDMVTLSEGRWRFVGRRGGVINVGGLKVHPEEIEAVINRHPGVRLSRVAGRKNPITGAVVVADIVLADADAPAEEVKAGVLAVCRDNLAPFKVPAIIRVAERLDMTAAGKLVRADA